MNTGLTSRTPAAQRQFSSARSPHKNLISRRRTATWASSGNNSTPGGAKDSYDMLQAFFIGRALAETLNERLGSAVSDVLAEVGRVEAELRRTVRDFQDEVMSRAEREMAASAGGALSGTVEGGKIAVLAAPPDLGEAVDNLRAEVASARALVQQIKQK